MIGLDTNVLVRYIAQDDPVQSRKTTERLPDVSLAAAIERILQIDALAVESEQEVFTAMIALAPSPMP